MKILKPYHPTTSSVEPSEIIHITSWDSTTGGYFYDITHTKNKRPIQVDCYDVDSDFEEFKAKVTFPAVDTIRIFVVEEINLDLIRGD